MLEAGFDIVCIKYGIAGCVGKAFSAASLRRRHEMMSIEARPPCSDDDTAWMDSAPTNINNYMPR